MWRRTSIFCLGLIGLTGCVAPESTEVQEPTSRLTIILVVDQMRADYIDRFEERFDGGLDLLLRDGRRFTNAHQQHNTTWTASGHTTLATGVHPARHGIVGNRWWDRRSNQEMSAITNDEVASTRLSRTPTINRAIRESKRGGSVWSVSIKDRAALPMAGSEASGAYYYQPSQRGFVASTHLSEPGAERPDWLRRFHEGGALEQQRLVWERLTKSAGEREDRFEGERLPNQFPHHLPDDDDFYGRLRYTPFGDAFTLDFASALIEGEGLGRDDREDLLWLSLSAADYIGHRFGPFSVEIEDYYFRLDTTLASWFDRLDSTVGEGRWRLLLTSDHGVVPLPEQSRATGSDAQRRSAAVLRADAKSALVAAGVTEDEVELHYTNGWYLVPAGAEAESWPASRWSEIRRRFADELLQLDYIDDAFTLDELQRPIESTRRYGELFVNGFDVDRSPDVQLVGRELDLLNASGDGTNHGSVHSYDTQVPLIAWGAGVTPGHDANDVGAVDLAPTLLRCFGVAPDGELDGRPLNGICSPAR